MSDSEIEVLPVVCCDICEDVLEDGWSENVRTETYSVVEACEACTRSLDWCSECDMHAQSVATLSESDWDGDGRHVCYYCLGRFYTRCGSCHNHYRFNDSHNCDPSIHDYTYKPYPVFRWASGEREVVPGTAFFGVEIESENRTSYGRSSVLALLRSGDVDEERHYFKYDGSLDSDVGVELVSHPSTLAAWREDSSNLDPSFVRNRIRLEMIPGIEALTGDSLSTLLSSTAERAQAEEEFWELELPRRAEGKLRLDRDACIFNVMPFLAEPLAVQRRLLRLAAAEVKGNLRGLDFSHIEALRALFTPGDGSARTQVPGLDAIRSFEWVRLTRLSERPEPRNVQVQMSVPGRTLLPELDIVIHLELLSPQAVYNKRVSALDLDRCNGPLILRNWRPGDQLRTAGKSSFDKVKTLFQEQRVPIWERRGWPVVACGDDVVWARQFGVSADFAASNHSPNAALIAEHFQVTESKRGFAASIELKRASGTGEPDAEVL